MTQSEKNILLDLARDAVVSAVEETSSPEVPTEGICAIQGGAFVTLKINNRLRGCIGHFSGLGSLGKTIVSMAREAAVGDPRFFPLLPEEIKNISIEISVLSPMERIQVDDVQPGTHGLYVRKGLKAGTLLPQVASEEGWGRTTFLAHTCLKAGLPPEAYMDDETEIFAYTAEVFGEKTI